MKDYKIGDIEFTDGGDRADRIMPDDMKVEKEIKESNADKKAGYDTENIQRVKYDRAFKNGEVKRGFSMGISFDKNGKII